MSASMSAFVALLAFGAAVACCVQALRTADFFDVMLNEKYDQVVTEGTKGWVPVAWIAGAWVSLLVFVVFAVKAMATSGLM